MTETTVKKQIDSYINNMNIAQKKAVLSVVKTMVTNQEY